MKVGQLQDRFLNALRKGQVPVTAYLVNGVPIKGRVQGFDSFVVFFDVDGKQQMVFKHAISTIQPARNVRITPGEGESDSEE
ncbi:MAG: RNA chaperone Hfq [Candidatus Hydrogenedentota bacterium]|nr:MAG: RNA chaperone Hfq [Candidatus Hydrogenedentota bacterium]